MLSKILFMIMVMLHLFCTVTPAQKKSPSLLNEHIIQHTSSDKKYSSLPLGGSEYWAGYWNGVTDQHIRRMGVAEAPMDYMAAICIPPGSDMAEDCVIEGVKVLFGSSGAVHGLNIFMSHVLPSSADKADICCQEVKDVTGLDFVYDPFNEIRFDHPYEYDSSKPLYIGYSFNVPDGTTINHNFPIVVHTGEEKENALLLSIGGGEWKDYYGEGFGILAMQVLMSSDFPLNDVTIPSHLDCVTAVKGTAMLPLEIKNAGSNGIDSITIVTDVDGTITEHEVVPDEKITGIGVSYRTNLEVNTPGATGDYEYKVSIKKINGADVPRNIEGSGRMVVVSRAVPHRVFLEEFTGMNHDHAPLGIASLNELRNIYGSNIVLVSVHEGDTIECEDYMDIIHNTVKDFPEANLDRRLIGINPYYGSRNNKNFGILNDIQNCMSVLPVADINVVPHLDGDILTAKTEVTFLYDGDAGMYSLAYVLTEDCMQDDDWLQANFLSGNVSGLDDNNPMLDPWIMDFPYVEGVVYNFVAIAASGIEHGIPGSLPKKARQEVTEIHYEDFDLTNKSKIRHRDRLNVIAVMFDTTTGRVVNSVCVPVNKEINGITETVQGVPGHGNSAVFTTDGRKIKSPGRGISIIRTNDGEIRKISIR